MEIYYEDTDITEYVRPRSCVLTDTCGNRADGLEMELEDAGTWFGWEPKEDDKIRITHNGYDSGEMYLSAILPGAGHFRIWATSLPCRARVKQTRSYNNLKISEIMNLCAKAAGMDHQIFGIDKNIVVPYIIQENESCAAFLRRLLRYEGATLKIVNGKYTAIGIEYAQDLTAAQTLSISVWQSGTIYQHTGDKYKRMIVTSPFASSTATDTDVEESHASIISNAQVKNAGQAKRWAKNMLLDMNRQCETLTVDHEFNPGFTAMARIDVEGETDADGEWLIEEVEHDFVGDTSTAIMHRCLRSVI